MEVPKEIIDAANAVGKWFDNQGYEEWQLGPCAARRLVPSKRFDKAQAAIALKVEMSGIPELDAMIRESRRLDMATAAMQALVSGNLDYLADAAKQTKTEVEIGTGKIATGFADALLAASVKEGGK